MKSEAFFYFLSYFVKSSLDNPHYDIMRNVKKAGNYFFFNFR